MRRCTLQLHPGKPDAALDLLRAVGTVAKAAAAMGVSTKEMQESIRTFQRATSPPGASLLRTAVKAKLEHVHVCPLCGDRQECSDSECKLSSFAADGVVTVYGEDEVCCLCRR